MRLLTNLSIKTKLNVLVLVAAGAALSLASVMLLVNDANLIRSSKIKQLSALANVLGANSTAALSFDDSSAAREVLSSLTLHPSVQFACLYNAKGRLFASYRREGTAEFSPPPPGKPGHEFVAGHFLDITQTVTQGTERIGTVYLHASMEDLYGQLASDVVIVSIVMIASMCLAILLSSWLQRIVSVPILQLTQTAHTISESGDYSIRVHRDANDELGALYHKFNGMLDQIQRSKQELESAHQWLECRVEERTRQLSQANVELSKQITDRTRAEQELQRLHQELLVTARKAGMAEVATGVLHNVGNVLNSINVSATLVTDHLRNSRISDFFRALELINRHESDLGSYLTHDEKGKLIPGFLRMLASRLNNDCELMKKELQSLIKNIDHIKAIVTMQQSYAGVSGFVETVSLEELIEDAIRMNVPSLQKHDIQLTREYDDLPEVRLEKQKLLQILVNLMTNAKDALVESGTRDRRLTVRIYADKPREGALVRIEVRDNGVGIAKQDLTRIFSHGYTTKRHGHGFGLHSSAIAARGLGGTLSVRSDGLGHGAVFTLELPYNPVEALV